MIAASRHSRRPGRSPAASPRPDRGREQHRAGDQEAHRRARQRRDRLDGDADREIGGSPDHVERAQGDGDAERGGRREIGRGSGGHVPQHRIPSRTARAFRASGACAVRQSRHDAPGRSLRRPGHEPRRLLPLVGDPAGPGARPLRRAPCRRGRGPDDQRSGSGDRDVAGPHRDLVPGGLCQRPRGLRRRPDPPRREHRLHPPRRGSTGIPRRAVRLHGHGQPGLRRHGRAAPDRPDRRGPPAALLPLDRAADPAGHHGLLRGGARRPPRSRHPAGHRGRRGRPPLRRRPLARGRRSPVPGRPAGGRRVGAGLDRARDAPRPGGRARGSNPDRGRGGGGHHPPGCLRPRLLPARAPRAPGPGRPRSRRRGAPSAPGGCFSCSAGACRRASTTSRRCMGS